MVPKFRAWDKNTNDMVDVKTIDLERDGSIGCIVDYSDINLDPSECILMQSTGLKDKNGVEIFDGDIVVIEYSRVGYRYYEKIIYENGAFLAGDDDWLFNVKDSCAVCGNIYENPELLEQADEN